MRSAEFADDRGRRVRRQEGSEVPLLAGNPDASAPLLAVSRARDATGKTVGIDRALVLRILGVAARSKIPPSIVERVPVPVVDLDTVAGR